MSQVTQSLRGPVLRNIDIADTQGCPFCYEQLSVSTSPFDQVLAKGPYETRLIPALGMLVPGYLLLTSEFHVPSFAFLDRDQLEGVESWLQQVEDQLELQFGDYLVVEHGACSYGNAGGCVIHAHLHVVPAPPGLLDSLLDDQEWEQIDGMPDLVAHRDEPYVYLGAGSRQFVSSDPPVPSQWIRRMLADTLGIDTWDWALDPGRDQLEETMSRLARVTLPVPE